MDALMIQPATVADIPVIRDLSQRIWPAAYGNILSAAQIGYMLDKMYGEQVLAAQMEEQGHRFVLALRSNTPVGFAAVSETAPATWKLHKIYVLPTEQGKGTGKKLIAYLKDYIRYQGGNTLLLNVNRYNKAKDFYEYLGFRILREEDIDIGNGYFMNDYIMQLELNDNA